MCTREQTTKSSDLDRDPREPILSKEQKEQLYCRLSSLLTEAQHSPSPPWGSSSSNDHREQISPDKHTMRFESLAHLPGPCLELWCGQKRASERQDLLQLSVPPPEHAEGGEWVYRSRIIFSSDY